MQIKIFTAMLFCTFTLAAGCSAQQPPDDSGISSARRPSIYPPKSAIEFPEDQVIKKKLQVTTQWQTISFEKPLKINRRGLMGLHLVVDRGPYISTTDDDPRNLECSDAEYAKNAFSLRRRSDWALIRPEAVLVGDNGVEVKVRPDGHLYPFFDRHVMTIILRGVEDINMSAPPFPRGIKAFTAMRIRSTGSLPVRYLWWSVDKHPYFLDEQ